MRRKAQDKTEPQATNPKRAKEPATDDNGGDGLAGSARADSRYRPHPVAAPNIVARECGAHTLHHVQQAVLVENRQGGDGNMIGSRRSLAGRAMDYEVMVPSTLAPTLCGTKSQLRLQ